RTPCVVRAPRSGRCTRPQRVREAEAPIVRRLSDAGRASTDRRPYGTHFARVALVGRPAANSKIARCGRSSGENPDEGGRNMHEVDAALNEVKGLYEKVLGRPAPAIEPHTYVPFP